MNCHVYILIGTHSLLYKIIIFLRICSLPKGLLKPREITILQTTIFSILKK